MPEQRIITCQEVLTAATNLSVLHGIGYGKYIWGVPRGGTPVAITIAALTGCGLATSARLADFIVDDVIDSDSTQRKHKELFPNKPFLALFDKTQEPWKGKWLVFPWEGTPEQSIENAVLRLGQYFSLPRLSLLEIHNALEHYLDCNLTAGGSDGTS